MELLNLKLTLPRTSISPPENKPKGPKRIQDRLIICHQFSGAFAVSFKEELYTCFLWGWEFPAKLKGVEVSPT